MTTNRSLARRAAGKPAELKLAAAKGDGDTTLPVSGVEIGDLVVGVVEYYSPNENTSTAIAAIHGGSVTAENVITVAGGSAIANAHSALVLYYDFD